MSYEEHVTKEIMDYLTNCKSSCGDLNSFKHERPNSEIDLVDYYLKVLPGANYILDEEVKFIFSNNLTTGRVEEDNRLKAFLYATNERDETNYSVLNQATRNAIAYGECGIRWYEDNIYLVPTGTYATLTTRLDGIERVIGYIATKDGKRIGERTLKLDEIVIGENETITDAILRIFDDRGWILVDKSDFVNLRNDTSELHGKSPFLYDSLRSDLLVTAYERLLHDLNYDGPGRIILWAKSGIISDDINEHSTSEIMRANPISNLRREEKARRELKEIIEEIKNSGSDNAMLLSNAFEKNVQHLPRVTKATEFFDWIKQEGVIVSQILGMAPGLIELGEMSGNVSMEKIIDNDMLNTIVPKREHYAVQYSSMLAEKLGVGKVYFNKYELQQAEDENTMRTKIANIISVLHSVDTPETDQLVKDFSEMLSNDIHHENNTLKELKVQKRRNENVKDGTGAFTGKPD